MQDCPHKLGRSRAGLNRGFDSAARSRRELRPDDGGAFIYAVVRELRYDAAKLSGAAGQLDEFQRLHASQPGYIGSLSVEAGQGRRVVVNLWQSEAQAFAGREALEPAVRRLVEPLLAAPAELLGAGPVVDNDLVHFKA